MLITTFPLSYLSLTRRCINPKHPHHARPPQRYTNTEETDVEEEKKKKTQLIKKTDVSEGHSVTLMFYVSMYLLTVMTRKMRYIISMNYKEIRQT